MPKSVKPLSPEEEELQHKKEEFEALEDQLAELELDLSSQKADVSSFIASVNAAIGEKLVEQALLQSRLAEARLILEPGNEEYKSQAQKAREDAEEARREQEEFVGDPRSSSTLDDFESAQQVRSSEDVRRLYIRLAKLAHPDMTTNPEEKERRTRFMQQVNAAYGMGDERLLEDLAKQWDASPESVQGKGVAVDLVRVIRQISLARDRIETVEKEMAEIVESMDYLMFFEARAQGLATYIADLEAALDTDIARLERELMASSAEK
jgi:hypothetical protein